MKHKSLIVVGIRNAECEPLMIWQPCPHYAGNHSLSFIQTGRLQKPHKSLGD